MKIIIVRPYGFCGGVRRAVHKVSELRKNNPATPIYIWGALAHNSHVIAYLESLNVQTLERTTDIKQSLRDLKKGIVVASAHGTSAKIAEDAKKMGFTWVDAACPRIVKMHAEIKKELANNREVVFYGEKNHPELEAVLSIDPRRIIPYYNDDENADFKLNDPEAVFFSQSTMVLSRGIKTYENLKKRYPRLSAAAFNCDATTAAQNNLVKIINDVDAVIVVGDKKSNNANNLAKIAVSYNKECFFIGDYNELDLEKIKNKEKVAIVSATSTPDWIVEDVIKRLSAQFAV